MTNIISYEKKTQKISWLKSAFPLIYTSESGSKDLNECGSTSLPRSNFVPLNDYVLNDWNTFGIPLVFSSMPSRVIFSTPLLSASSASSSLSFSFHSIFTKCLLAFPSKEKLADLMAILKVRIKTKIRKYSPYHNPCKIFSLCSLWTGLRICFSSSMD